MKVLTRLGSFLLLSLVLSSCGGASGKNQVTRLMSFGWDPMSLAADPGDHVIFQNVEAPKMQIVATSPSDAFGDKTDMRIHDKGGAFEWTIPKDFKVSLVRFEDNITLKAGSIAINVKP